MADEALKKLSPIFDEMYAKGGRRSVRFSLDARGLAFTLYATIRETADGELVQQELRKRAIDRLRRSGIARAPVNPFAAFAKKA